MSEYREESVRRRDVRSGINLEKERAVRGTGTSRADRVEREWVVVYYFCRYNRHGVYDDKFGPPMIAIWGTYRKEEDAKRVVDNAHRHPYSGCYRDYYCERGVFDRIKAVLIALNAKDKEREADHA